MDVSEYDKRLFLKKTLDGSVSLYRKSPFFKNKDYKIKTYTNTFFGGGRWLKNEIIAMDTQRHSIIESVSYHNRRLRDERPEDRRMHREIAEFIAMGGNAVLL
jgi:hypothetical protein